VGTRTRARKRAGGGRHTSRTAGRTRSEAGTLVVTTGYSIGGDFACAAEVRSEYDGLLSAGLRADAPALADHGPLARERDADRTIA